MFPYFDRAVDGDDLDVVVDHGDREGRDVDAQHVAAEPVVERRREERGPFYHKVVRVDGVTELVGDHLDAHVRERRLGIGLVGLFERGEVRYYRVGEKQELTRPRVDDQHVGRFQRVELALDAVVVDVIKLRRFAKEVHRIGPPLDQLPDTNIEE